MFDTIQRSCKACFEEFGGGRKVDTEWEQISYRDAALWYGSDKPDLRNPIKMQVVSEHFKGSGFAIFAKSLNKKALKSAPSLRPAAARVNLRPDERIRTKEGLPGMGYIFWRDQGEGMEAAGPLAKNIGPERTEAIRQQLGLEVGDAAFFLGGKPKSFESVAGRARVEIGNELKLTDLDRFAFARIVDFPIYEKTRKPVRSTSSTTRSLCRKVEWTRWMAIRWMSWAINMTSPAMATNWFSGAIRNHRPEIMFKAFEIAGYGKDEVEKRFGGMVQRIQIRRSAPRRLCCRHRPHRDAAGGRGQHSRSDPVPDEPTRRRP